MTAVPAPTAPPRPAVFLDRDGTLIVERNYLSDPAGVELLPGATTALKQLREAGFRLVVATNQSGIGRGYYTIEDMHRVNARLVELLRADGVDLAGIYFSPEGPDASSTTRKPLPGMLLAARDELGLDLSRSYMVGDKLADVECGRNAGVRAALLVRTGWGADHERDHADGLAAANAVVVDDLPAAAAWILADHPSAPR